MKISVVIPAYNAAETIVSALNSVFAQSLPPIEIIVVDDASTDHTIKLLEEFGDKIELILHNENKGVSAARNTGWAAVTGDYIAFLDSDDVWHPQKLEMMSQCFLQNPDTLFAGHSFSIEKHFLEQSFELKDVRHISFSKLLARNRFQGSSIVVKKILPVRFEESLRYCEDYDLALRAAYQHDCLFLDLPLTILSRPQLSKGGLSGNHKAMRMGELRTYSRLWKLNYLLLPFIPFLWIYSFLKHLRKQAS